MHLSLLLAPRRRFEKLSGKVGDQVNLVVDWVIGNKEQEK
jgi:hypothetical protein